MTNTVLEDEEANRIAAELAAKYGNDALEFVRSRAERAQSVGDELAYGAWQSVLDATEALLGLKSIPAE
jgi:hypothetical protein